MSIVGLLVGFPFDNASNGIQIRRTKRQYWGDTIVKTFGQLHLRDYSVLLEHV